MAESVVAFAPGHISGYFKRIDADTVQRTGSIGAGIVIDKGVYVKMSHSEITHVTINGDETDSWLISEVLNQFGLTADVEVNSEMPIGSGFGMSAAGLLAAYYAADNLFELNLSKEEIASKSHAAEVKHGTGLGDVAAENVGGLVIRTKPGIHGVYKRIYPKKSEFCAVTLGKINTPDVISSKEMMEKVYNAFPENIPADIEEFMADSIEFSRNSGLMTKDVERIIADCESQGVMASMTMLGEGVFAYGENAESILKKYGKTYNLKINFTGPCIKHVQRRKYV